MFALSVAEIGRRFFEVRVIGLRGSPDLANVDPRTIVGVGILCHVVDLAFMAHR